MTTYHSDTEQNPSRAKSNGGESHSMADAALEQLETRAAQAREVADKTRQQVTDTAQRATDQGAQFVRDNPALALAGAVGFGILLGLAVKSRD